MVAVVQEEVQANLERIEDTAPDAFGLHELDEVGIDEADASHIVVEDTDFDACLYAVFQDLLDGLPALSVLDRMVFHEDELLGFAELLFLSFYAFGRIVVVFDQNVFICRESCAVLEIFCDIRGTLIGLAKMLFRKVGVLAYVNEVIIRLREHHVLYSFCDLIRFRDLLEGFLKRFSGRGYFGSVYGGICQEREDP